MAAWSSANILATNAGGKRLWQMAADGSHFSVNKETALLANESAPSGAVGKDWQDLFRRKLNLAWLPADKVFIRAVQLPTSDPAEIQSMVELQLEKLSPLPVTHIVWSTYLVPKPVDKPESLQTVIVIMALRSFVEEYLGELEGIGFLADRLECPALDELLAVNLNEDGVWIFPGEDGQPALVVWRQASILQNVTLVSLPPGPDRAEVLKRQIEQIAWAAELEGWLAGPPAVHLVASQADAAYWDPALRDLSERPIDVRPPIAAAKLAALGAERCAADGVRSNLLPPEFATRYRQQFIDGLWMRGVSVVFGIYLAGVLAYFGALYSLRLALQKEKTDLAGISAAYKESQKDRQEIDILKKRAELQYAALDAWKAVAEALPEGLTVNDMDFREGKLELRGDAPADDLDAVYTFNSALRRATKSGQDSPLFAMVDDPKTVTRNQVIEWSFKCNMHELEGGKL